MKKLINFGIMVLMFGLALYIPNLNSTLLGINLTTADSSIVTLIQLAFIIIGFGFLVKTVGED